ncbi:MAG: hypothetical protein GXO47_14435 [Chlorobi bacterium]|nr:hypothetical protein [Chlorobiota bacterium]
MSYNFIYNTLPVEMAEKWNNILPGIDRIIFIGGTGSYEEWTAEEWSKNNMGFDKKELAVTPDIFQKILEQRLQKDRFGWIAKQEIPFYLAKGAALMQRTLFDELNYLILVITVRAKGNDLSDLFYLFFRGDKSNFGIQHDSSPFNTIQKSIIGTMALNFAREFYKSSLNFLEKTDFLRNETVRLLEYHSGKTTGGSNKHFLEWKKQWALSYIESLSDRRGISYSISDEALNTLLNTPHNFKHVKQALTNAAKFAYALAAPGVTTAEIRSSYIVFGPEQDNIDSSESAEKMNRMDKAYQLLEKLENAAQKLIANEIRPSSERIGKAMDKQITAPAIRDAIKKNQNRILQLLRKYPDKWPYIRKEFRPVLNIMPNSNYIYEKGTG